MKKSIFDQVFLYGLLIFSIIVNVYSFVNNPLSRFKYFTNQSNLLVLVVILLVLLNKQDFKLFKYLSFSTLISISITGIIYNILLRGFKTSGFESIQNELTHLIIPLMYIYYYFKIEISDLKNNKFYVGLIHPILYLIVFLIVGKLTNWYPYPFMNINENGLNQLLIITPLVILLSYILIYIKGYKKREVQYE